MNGSEVGANRKVERRVAAIAEGRPFQALTTIARIAQQGAFVLALYDTAVSRQYLVAQLRRRIAPLPCLEYAVTSEHPQVQDYLRQMSARQRGQRAVVCLYDVEAALPDAACWLDRQRDQLAAHPHTLVVWLHRNAFGQLLRLAPNFCSRHSGVFDFYPEMDEIETRT